MRLWLRTFAAVQLGLWTTACSLIFDYGPPQKSTISFDIVVKMQTKKGLVEGVSNVVVDKKFYKGREDKFCTWMFCLEDKEEYSYNGRATTVHLPDGGQVIVLLSGKNYRNYLREYTDEIEKRQGDFGSPKSIVVTEKISRRSGQFKQHDMGEGYTGLYRKDSLPYFVKFDDFNKLATIHALDPYNLAEDFSDRPFLVSIEIRDGNIASDADISPFPWLQQLPTLSQNNNFPSDLTRASFSQGRSVMADREAAEIERLLDQHIATRCAAKAPECDMLKEYQKLPN